MTLDKALGRLLVETVTETLTLESLLTLIVLDLSHLVVPKQGNLTPSMTLCSVRHHE